ncbi:MAG: universal stress protein [Candidatus Nanopelagicales bacterium]|nr:universal stress protein [Candidatus Nanopelagicales bacterium]
MSKPIVVGYDASESANRGLEWAAVEASGRGLPLVVLTAWNTPSAEITLGGGSAMDRNLFDVLRDDATKTAEGGVARALEVAPDVDATAEVWLGPPAAGIVEASKKASVVVVGSQGQGGIRGLLLGSVSRQVAAHAKCPAIIVRKAENPDSRVIVVGVDGSPQSIKALDLAFDEASRRAYSLRVLHTWEVPPIGAITGVPTFAPPEMLADLSGIEMRTTSEALAGFRDRYPDVSVHQDVQRGTPVKALVKASRDAIAVVVGSRGRGGFTGLLLGSVSHGVAHQAHCTVVVVP